MLTGLSLRNFKCFESVDIPLGRITVLIGPNGSGKSSVLHALALLRQSFGQGRIEYVGPLVDLSTYEDSVFQMDTTRRIKIKYAVTRVLGDTDFAYDYKVSAGNNLELLSQEWRYGGWLERVSWSIDGAQRVEVRRDGLSVDLSGVPSVGTHIMMTEAEPILSEGIRQIFNRIVGAPKNDMLTWRYTPASRGFTRASYKLLDQGIDEITSNIDTISLASGLASSIAYDDDLRDQISAWLHGITEVEIDSRVATGARTFIRSKRRASNTYVKISGEGFGTNQLTYMLFQLAKTPNGGLDMIEEPELHLHPYAIARLADLLATEAVKSDKQLLLTTHSEHLLLGLLNNVAEGKLPHTDLVVLSTSLAETGAKVEQVKINDEGLAEGGLPGFFDATLEAQRRHLDALIRRG